jgi:aryl-alcohol dehydrogenase-like predicted oxidoreductase
MEYRYLGKTGLKVSVLSFGNMVTDNPQNNEHIDLYKACFDAGINFFDTAEFYTNGKAEETLGISLKKYNIPRDEIVVSTKIYLGINENEHN